MSEALACVILNYNDADNTLNLVRKIRCYDTLDYIVIVDNCSTDDSLNKIRKVADDKVIPLEQKTNGGYGAGNNAGIRYAHDILGCKHVIIANPDVEFSEECISELHKAFGAVSDIAVAAPVQFLPDGSMEKEYAWRIPTIKQWVLSPEHVLHHHYWPSYTCEEMRQHLTAGNTTMEVECVPGAMLMVDSGKFLGCDGYDEENFLYCEETVLGIKLREKGYKTVLLLNQRYLHNESQTISKNISDRESRKALMMKSRCWFLKKWLKASPAQCWIGRRIGDIAVLETKISAKTGIQ